MIATEAAPIVVDNSTATYLTTDTTTIGNWRNSYGADGYFICNDSSVSPSYATVTLPPQPYTWLGSTSDPRGLEKGAGGDRIASTWFGSTFSITVNATDGQLHKLALYFVDWYNEGRVQTVTVRKVSDNSVLDGPLTLSSFEEGLYLVWNIRGNVRFDIALTSGINSIVSGIFFGNGTAANAAAWIGTDTTTRGNWPGVYGLDGRHIVLDSPQSYPSYLASPWVTSTGTGFPWANPSSPSDTRAPWNGYQTNRLATAWYHSTSFDISINLTDSQFHNVELYCLDWDGGDPGGGPVRGQTIEVLDGQTGASLSPAQSVPVPSFHDNGVYMKWSVKGNVKFRVTKTAGANGVVSGVFFR